MGHYCTLSRLVIKIGVRLVCLQGSKRNGWYSLFALLSFFSSVLLANIIAFVVALIQIYLQYSFHPKLSFFSKSNNEKIENVNDT